MEEDSNSWIRRAKFSHTVCHRLDSSRLSTIPFAIQQERIAGLKSRPAPGFSNPKSFPSRSSSGPNSSSSSSFKRNPVTNKQRSLSPHPETKLSDTFKEAQSEKKRFSTPTPIRRSESDKGFKGKRSSSSSSLNASPLRHLASMMINGDKSKGGRKDSPWSKYFDPNGCRVSAVEEADEWSVDMSKLFLGNKFAHGARSRLYHGMYDGEAVAVKIMCVPDDDETGVLAARLEKQFVSEVTLLSRLHHENVIKLKAACRKTPVYCVITEYLQEGSLRAFLHKLENKALPYPKLIAFALDIARGMEYIHSQGMIHRDLKPENILIDRNFHMKVADFGTACEEAYCDNLADDPGTYRWMAPEMIKHKSYNRKVDVYSFGLILWEMVAGTIPYDDMNPIQAAFAVVNKNLRPVIPANCPPAMRALIEQCWSLQAEKRPEFWQVVKVLEQFETSLARDGTLNLVQNQSSCQDHKKGLLHWIQKLGPTHPHNSTPVPKPKFS